MFADNLRVFLEAEEARTVGKSFGGTGPSAAFSVPKIRDWVLEKYPEAPEDLHDVIMGLGIALTPRDLQNVIAAALRFSFLIELTDLRVGSTKMKTRWIPGSILMPQEGSFEPIQGTFQPGDDPRASSFDECFDIFCLLLQLVLEYVSEDETLAGRLRAFSANNRVPYEFPFTYLDAQLEPIHCSENVTWAFNDDVDWLSKARAILKGANDQDAAAIKAICDKKLSVKVYKTDRALTGKDKTNRAKRWEVLAGDFQHATLPECWSVERKLTEQLVCFRNFPDYLRQAFQDQNLIEDNPEITCCPVTLSPLDFGAFAAAVLDVQHGRSDYQIGHMVPLKRGGRHVGENVSWQSADGNRIQGDLSLTETRALLEAIHERAVALNIQD